MQTGFLDGAGLGLMGRKYCFVSIKVIEVDGKSPQFTETNVCMCPCVCVCVCVCVSGVKST